MVLLHGWSCDRRFLEPQLVHFASSHRVVAVDLRGHGESEAPPDGYEIESLADDVRSVMAAEGLVAPVVIGHSLGAAVALALGATEDASAVAMLEPTALVGPMKDLLVAVGTAPFVDDHDGALRAQLARSMFGPHDDVTRQSWIVETMASQPLDVALAAMEATHCFRADDALRACRVPLLSIGATVPVNPPDLLQTLCPHIVIGQTVGSGHFIQLEVPDQVNAMIQRFLATKAPSLPRP